MNNSILFLIAMMALMMLCMYFLTNNTDLNHIKSKTVGDGQHGTARFASPKEIEKTYSFVPFKMCIRDRALQSVITGTVQVSEDRIASLLFKLAVEMSMMMHILAANLDVDNQTLDRLRGKCVQDVKRSIGSVDFKRVTNYQKNNL